MLGLVVEGRNISLDIFHFLCYTPRVLLCFALVATGYLVNIKVCTWFDFLFSKNLETSLITDFRVCSMAMTSFAVVAGKIAIVDGSHSDRINVLWRVARERPAFLESLMRVMHPGLTSYELPEELLTA